MGFRGYFKRRLAAKGGIRPASRALLCLSHATILSYFSGCFETLPIFNVIVGLDPTIHDVVKLFTY